jgi:murein hydrolase activator
MIHSFRFIILFLACFFVFSASAQRKKTKSRVQLEQEKKRNLAKMDEAKKILTEASQQKKASINKLKAIQEQIETKSEQINLMSDDIDILDVEMSELENTNQKLGTELENLKKEYGETLYRASKKSSQLNQLGFLFAAPNFTQLVMRFKYLQQYTETRKIQLRQIQKVQVMIAEKKENVSDKKSVKSRVLQAKIVEAKNLEQMEGQRSGVVKELTSREAELKAEVLDRQRSISKLEGAIANLVAREVRRRDKAKELKVDRIRIAKEIKAGKKPTKAEKIPDPSPNEREFDDEADIKLANSFAASKNQLPWPTRSGFISERFGVHPHPFLPGVKIRNDGINIQTAQNAVVRTVYDGVVVDIATIQGNGKVVAIQHGDYYTVYTRLKETFVNINQKVRSKETIGTAATMNGNTEINFQIWKNTAKQNPESWLGGR